MTESGTDRESTSGSGYYTPKEKEKAGKLVKEGASAPDPMEGSVHAKVKFSALSMRMEG